MCEFEGTGLWEGRSPVAFSRRRVGDPPVVLKSICALVLLSSMVSFHPWTSGGRHLPVKEVIFLLGAGVLSALGGSYLVHRLKRRFGGCFDTSLLMFVCWILLSALWSPWSNPLLAASGAAFLLAWGIYYSFFHYCFLYRETTALTVRVVSFGLTLNLGAAVCARLAGGGAERLIGFMGNVNFLSYLFVLLLPLQLFVILEGEDPSVGWWYPRELTVFNLAAGAWLLWVGGCRGALLCAAAAVAAVAFFRRFGADVVRCKKAVWSVAVLLLLGSPFALHWAVGDGAGILSGSRPDKTDSLRARGFCWKLVLDAVPSAPLLGHGLYSFANEYPSMCSAALAGFPAEGRRNEPWRFVKPMRRVHDEFLQILYEQGIVGLLLLLRLLYCFLTRFFEVQQTIPAGSPESRLGWTMFTAVGVAVLASLFSFPFRLPTLALICALHCSGALAVRGEGGRQEVPWCGLAAAVPVWCVSLLLVGLGCVRYVCLTESGLGDASCAEGRWTAAAARYESALRWNPWCAPALHGLGRCLVEMGRYGEAERVLRRAASVHHDYTVHVNLGTALAGRNEREKALAEFMEALREHPCAETFHFAAFACDTMERRTDAETLYRLALECDRRWYESAYNLALLYLQEGRYREASRLLAENVRLRERECSGGGRPRPYPYGGFWRKHHALLQALQERLAGDPQSSELIRKALEVVERHLRPDGGHRGG